MSPESAITETTVHTTTTTAVLVTTTTLSPEEVAALEFEADVKLIKALTRGLSDSWFAGFDAGIEYTVEHNYPDEDCTFDEYLEDKFGGSRIEDYQEEWVVDAGTIERDDGWIIPGGRANGTAAKGRGYIASSTFTQWASGYDFGAPPTLEVHFTILDGRAYFFVSCSP